MAREEAKRLGLKFIERHVSSIEELRKGVAGAQGRRGGRFFLYRRCDGGEPGTTNHRHGKNQEAADDVSGCKVWSPKAASPVMVRTTQEIGRLSPKFVQKVLNGTLPRDLRIETFDDVELAINLRTAKALGLTIPPNVLARAKKVIK